MVAIFYLPTGIHDVTVFQLYAEKNQCFVKMQTRAGGQEAKDRLNGFMYHGLPLKVVVLLSLRFYLLTRLARSVGDADMALKNVSIVS